MNKKQKIGRMGETFAENMLQLDGYEILMRNYSCRHGEIDIIATKENEMFFIEVKTRTNRAFGDPSESVTEQKRRHLRKTASAFLAEYKPSYDFFSFQVIEVGFNQIEQAF